MKEHQKYMDQTQFCIIRKKEIFLYLLVVDHLKPMKIENQQA